MQQKIWSFRLALFVAGSMSVGSLLLYFFGVAAFSRLSATLSAVELVLLLFLAWWAWSSGWEDPKRLLVSGLWAGCLATLAYDVVRVPIAHAGVPVFKAISYFGTVLLGQDRPSPMSEVLGWAYHLSNGASFALMYVALAVRPGPITAVLWGLSLEAAMLLTPYAEIFGYQRDARFLAITIGSHAVYGLVLWLGLRRPSAPHKRWRPAWVAASGLIAVPLGLSAIAADFNGLYGRKIPESPPPYMGPHLLTVWNVAEPDRVAVIWVTKRFVDHDAVFHFIEPFDKVNFGTPFDMPEASVRRSGTQSATQVVLARRGLKDAGLVALGRMTGLTEVTPWMLVADVEAAMLADRMRQTAASKCGKSITNSCLPDLLADLDAWYGTGSR